jgi:hypothetical protein
MGKTGWRKDTLAGWDSSRECGAEDVVLWCVGALLADCDDNARFTQMSPCSDWRRSNCSNPTLRDCLSSVTRRAFTTSLLHIDNFTRVLRLTRWP